jgi:uncharacterized protein (TIGR02147 family)
MKQPCLYQYLDVSLYLKDFYKFKKSSAPSFSYEFWANEIGFKSRGHLRDIIIGKAELTESLIPVFIKGLKLNPNETEHFTLLVRYSTAKSEITKAIYGKILMANWKAKLNEIEIVDIESFLSDSVTPIVFTYLSFDDTASDLKEISSILGYEQVRVQNALRCLIWQKLVDGQIDDRGLIKYKTTQPFFKIPDVPGDNFLRNFHVDGLKLAIQAHDYPSQSRKFYSTFVALDQNQFVEIQNLVQDCHQKILALCNKPQLGTKKIYRLNTQIFPVSSVSETTKTDISEKTLSVLNGSE